MSKASKGILSDNYVKMWFCLGTQNILKKEDVPTAVTETQKELHRLRRLVKKGCI